MGMDVGAVFSFPVTLNLGGAVGFSVGLSGREGFGL